MGSAHRVGGLFRLTPSTSASLEAEVSSVGSVSRRLNSCLGYFIFSQLQEGEAPLACGGRETPGQSRFPEEGPLLGLVPTVALGGEQARQAGATPFLMELLRCARHRARSAGSIMSLQAREKALPHPGTLLLVPPEGSRWGVGEVPGTGGI